MTFSTMRFATKIAMMMMIVVIAMMGAMMMFATTTVAASATISISPTFALSSSAQMHHANALLHMAKRTATATGAASIHPEHTVIIPSRVRTAPAAAAAPTPKSCAACIAPILVSLVNTTINEVNAVCANTTDPAIIEVCGMLDQFGSLWLSYVISVLEPGYDAYWSCIGAQQCAAPVDFYPLVAYTNDPVSLLYLQIQTAFAYLSPNVYGLSVLQPTLPNSTVVTTTGPDDAAAATAATAAADCETCVFNYAETVLTRYTTVFSDACTQAFQKGTDAEAIDVCKFCQAQAAAGTDYCRSVVYVIIQPPRFGEGYCIAQSQCQWSNITTAAAAAIAPATTISTVEVQ